MEYQIQLFYDPRRVGYIILRDIYTACGLTCPPAEDLRKPFHTDKKTGVETATTGFSTTRRDMALELVYAVMDVLNVDISHSR